MEKQSRNTEINVHIKQINYLNEKSTSYTLFFAELYMEIVYIF